MKCLLIEPGPSFSVSDVATGWVHGLNERGVETRRFNYTDRLQVYSEAWKKPIDGGDFVKMFSDEAAVELASKGILSTVMEWWPDLVLAVSGFYLPESVYRTLRGHRRKVVLLCTESPYEDDSQLARAALADWVILNDPTNLPRFREVNKRTAYIPHGHLPWLHHPGEPVAGLESDFAFVGTGYPGRSDFFAGVDWTGIDAKFGGNWSNLPDDHPVVERLVHPQDACYPNDQTALLYRSTKASVNLYRREAQRDELVDGWAMGPREVELAASGTFYLRQPRGENEIVLPMLPTFDGPGDFAEKLRWWLAHDDHRQAVADEARAAVEDRTFDVNALRLLHLIYG